MRPLSSWASRAFSSPWLIPFLPRRGGNRQRSSDSLAASNHSSQFANSKCINLETYRQNGNPVRTPVWFVEKADKLFVITGLDSGKVKRIRNSPRTRVTPSSFAGEPRGDWVDATAGFANEIESKIALRLMNRKYNALKWAHDVYSWILGRRYTIIELTLRI
jgi:uncharacterized protein